MNDALRDRLIAASGAVESGYIGNARTLRTSLVIHVRIVGEDRTACGKPLNGVSLWHYVSRSRFPSLPELYRNGCASCLRSEVVTATRGGTG